MSTVAAHEDGVIIAGAAAVHRFISTCTLDSITAQQSAEVAEAIARWGSPPLTYHSS